MRTLITIVLLAFAVNVSTAQNSQWFSLDAGVKSVEGETGIGLNGKFSFKINRFFAEVNPLDLTFVPEGVQDGYREETTSDGRTICRDTSNGQFAQSENCEMTYSTYYAVSGNINYSLSDEVAFFYFGPGFRLGTATTPYINVGLIFGNGPFSKDQHWFVKSSAGKQFFELSVGTSINLK